LISQGVVYKTPFAGLIGQAIGGTVDLRTIKPLSAPDRVFSVSARAEFSGQGSLNPDVSGVGYRFTGTYVDQFLDNTLGVAVGIAAQSSPQQNEQFNAWGYAGGGTADSPFVIGGTKPFVGSTELERIGAFGSVQWNPTPWFETSVDTFYTDFNEDNVIRGIEFPLAFGLGPSGQVDDGNSFIPPDSATITQIQDGFATAGAIANVRGVLRNDENIRRAELFSAGWNTKILGEKWSAEFDFSYSRATRRDTLVEVYAGTGFGRRGGAADTLTITQAPGQIPQFSSRLNYNDPNLFVLTDPLGWGGSVVQAGFINAPNTDDELYHLRGAVNRELNWGLIDTVQIGFDYGDRQKERQIFQTFLTLPNGLTELAIPSQAILSESTGLFFLGFGPQLTLDTSFLVNNVLDTVTTTLSSFSTPQD